MDEASHNIVKHKIVTAEELRKIIGAPPRKKTVIMCHGTFDIVHPGHIRHLLYAKSKADLLVASLTCDDHIKKANFRPFVPEDLRAINLAALEIVDYVIIDRDPTPIKNLSFIRPDYFAKGYEYGSEGLPPKTQEESDAVEAYGGEIIFTPGDIVYSSSHIIEKSPPNLATEKLIMLFEAEGLSIDDLHNAVDGFKDTKVHVVGDTIIDSYTHTTLIGGMSKTPTMSVRFEEKDDFVGGAGIVAKHINATGADVTFSTVLGEDTLADFALEDLTASGVKCIPIVDKTRPTINKNSIIAGSYHLLKVDTVDNRSISENIMKQLQKKISSTETDVVVFSDFRHGIFNRDTIGPLTSSIPAATTKVADSQVASRWGNILEFQGFDLITPNEREARFALGDQDSVVRPLGLELYRKANCGLLILKMGERGLLTYRSVPKADEDVRSFFTVDTFCRNVVDAVGAGDALLAYASLALKSTGNEVLSSVLGAIAAALACEQEGNIPIGSDAVHERIKLIENHVNFC
jgi:rfaE bifunctional protein kinase chain/domain